MAGVFGFFDVGHHLVETLTFTIALEDVGDMIGLFSWLTIGMVSIGHWVIVLSVVLDGLAWKLLVGLEILLDLRRRSWALDQKSTFAL